MAAPAVDFSVVFDMIFPTFAAGEISEAGCAWVTELLATHIHTPEQWAAFGAFVQARLNERNDELQSAIAGAQGARHDMADATEAAVVLGALADDAADAQAANEVAMATERYEAAKAYVASVQRSVNPLSDMLSYIGARAYASGRA